MYLPERTMIAVPEGDPPSGKSPNTIHLGRITQMSWV